VCQRQRVPRRTPTPRRVPAGVTKDVYLRLLASYRVKPGEHTHAARLAGCSANTAQKAWERGLKNPPEAKVPIREQLAAQVPPPAETPPQAPGAPTPPTGRVDLAERVERAQHEALEVADLARTSCMLLNKGIVQIAPNLLALGVRADESLALMLKSPRDKDPEKEARRCLAMMTIGAKLGRTVSLITKSQHEADRALVESLRTPFVVEPKPEQPGGGASCSEGGEGLTDDELLDEIERHEAGTAAATARIRARLARDRGDALPAPEPSAVHDGGSAPKPAPPPVPLDGTQPDTMTPAATPSPPPQPTAPAGPPPPAVHPSLAGISPAVLAHLVEIAGRHGLTPEQLAADVRAGSYEGPALEVDAAAVDVLLGTPKP
jgi:hypothetical protein